MDIKWLVAEDASGSLLVRIKGSRSPATRRACTVAQACRLIRRSRRHIYRYLESGVLTPYGKFLGEWLLDPEQVRSLAALPVGLQRPPRRSQVLFPEYSLGRLNPYRDRRLILARMLDQGDRAEIAWVLRRYPKREIVDFLSVEGPRLLSAKSLRFWSLYLGSRPPEVPAWRERGRRWGGGG